MDPPKYMYGTHYGLLNFLKINKMKTFIRCFSLKKINYYNISTILWKYLVIIFLMTLE